MKKISLFIVSAFGRGASIAAKMGELGFDVTLLDLGKQLGEDPDEGPFPCFWQKLNNVESERLKQGCHRIELAHGLTLMTPRGPIEFGVLQPKANLFPPFQMLEWQNEFWFQMFATSVKPNAAPLPFPLSIDHAEISGPTFYRATSRTDWPQVADWLAVHRVRVLPTDSNLKDIVLAKKVGELHQFEINLGGQSRTEIFEADYLIWCLSGEETQFFSPVISQKMYPQGVSQAELIWRKKDMTVSIKPGGEEWSKMTAWIRDPELHWMRDNFFVLVPTINSERFELWFKLPVFHRGHQWEEQKIVQNILNYLHHRLPMHQFHISLDSTNSSGELDRFPSRFPIFNVKDLITEQMITAPAFSYLGPEKRRFWGWNGWLQIENEEVPKLEEFFRRSQEKNRKKEVTT